MKRNDSFWNAGPVKQFNQDLDTLKTVVHRFFHPPLSYLKKKNVISKSTDINTVMSISLALLLLTGFLSSFILVKTGQDIRQQASTGYSVTCCVNQEVITVATHYDCIHIRKGKVGNCPKKNTPNQPKQPSPLPTKQPSQPELSTSTICGDGACGTSESYATCPSDCWAQKPKPSASQECPQGYIGCAGCITDYRCATKTCNEWIDQECAPGAEGTYPPSGQNCNPGLIKCANGRCSRACALDNNPVCGGIRAGSNCQNEGRWVCDKPDPDGSGHCEGGIWQQPTSSQDPEKKHDNDENNEEKTDEGICASPIGEIKNGATAIVSECGTHDCPNDSQAQWICDNDTLTKECVVGNCFGEPCAEILDDECKPDGEYRCECRTEGCFWVEAANCVSTDDCSDLDTIQCSQTQTCIWNMDTDNCISKTEQTQESCTPNTIVCQKDQIRVCSSEGYYYLTKDCASGLHCDPTGKPLCIGDTCQPNSFITCIDEISYQQCNSKGTNITEKTCAEDEICSVGFKKCIKKTQLSGDSSTTTTDTTQSPPASSTSTTTTNSLFRFFDSIVESTQESIQGIIASLTTVTQEIEPEETVQNTQEDTKSETNNDNNRDQESSTPHEDTVSVTSATASNGLVCCLFNLQLAGNMSVVDATWVSSVSECTSKPNGRVKEISHIAGSEYCSGNQLIHKDLYESYSNRQSEQVCCRLTQRNSESPQSYVFITTNQACSHFWIAGSDYYRQSEPVEDDGTCGEGTTYTQDDIVMEEISDSEYQIYVNEQAPNYEQTHYTSNNLVCCQYYDTTIEYYSYPRKDWMTKTECDTKNGQPTPLENYGGTNYCSNQIEPTPYDSQMAEETRNQMVCCYVESLDNNQTFYINATRKECDALSNVEDDDSLIVRSTESNQCGDIWFSDIEIYDAGFPHWAGVRLK